MRIGELGPLFWREMSTGGDEPRALLVENPRRPCRER